MGGKSRKKRNQEIVIPTQVFFEKVRNLIKTQNAYSLGLVQTHESLGAYSLGLVSSDNGGAFV